MGWEVRMNNRQQQELQMLMKSERLDISQLAASFDVSERTIHYDIETINTLAGELLGMPRLIEVRHGQACARPGVPEWAYLCDLLRGDPQQDGAPALSARERIPLIAADLCWHEGYTSMQDLAEKYAVSYATMVRDISKVRTYCESVGLAVDARKGAGIRLLGDEDAKRRLLSQVLHSYAEHSGTDGSRSILREYASWFDVESLTAIQSIVVDAEDEFSIVLDDVAFEAIVIHVALAIKRSRNKTSPRRQPIHTSSGLNDFQVRIASYIADRVNAKFAIGLPAGEVQYIAVHVGAHSAETIARGGQPDAPVEYMCIKIIAEVGHALGVDFSQDDKLFQSLVQHVRGCMYRERMGLLSSNPLRVELEVRHAKLFGVVRRAIATSALQREIVTTDDEVSYFLLYFLVALNRLGHTTEGRATVLVACAMGMGTAELISIGLQRRFDVNVVAKVPVHQIESELTRQPNIDLVVSTVAVGDVRCPHVVVRPLMGEADLERVAEWLRTHGFNASPSPVRPRSKVARMVTMLAARYPDQRDERILLDELELLVQDARDSLGRTAGRRRAPMLSELLDVDHIRLDVDAADWRDAVRKEGAILIGQGDITGEYVEAIIQNVEEKGPYIVITKGVALPHATNKTGVVRTSMAYVRLARPIDFGSEDNDPVEHMFMLTTADATSHLEALRSLVGLLAMGEFLGFLHAAASPEDVAEFIQSHEKKLGA